MKNYIKKLNSFIKTYPNITTFVLGALACLAQPPFFVGLLLFPAFTLLIYLLDGCQSKKQAFVLGWAFGMGYFCLGLYWFAHALLVDAQKFAWLIPFADLGLPAILSIYYGIVTLITYAANFTSWRKIVLFSVLWVTLELLRAYLFTGFPWILIGYSWSWSAIILQFTSIFGIYGLSFVTILVASMPYTLLRDEKASCLPILICIVLAIIITIGGYYRLENAHHETYPDLSVRVVQGNISQDLMTSEEGLWQTIAQYIRLSQKHLDKNIDNYENIPNKIKLILWPESSVPLAVNNRTVLDIIKQAIPKNSYLIAGTIHTPDYLKIWYNSAHIIDDKGEIIGHYNKHHLVPFGEYVPFKSILPIDKIVYGLENWVPGEGSKSLIIEDALPAFSPIICYEGIFPGEVTDHKGAAKWLVNLTNDGWFGMSSGPYQHFYMVRTRAVEEGIPLVRAANTGISAIIDAYGVIKNSLGLGEEGVIDGALPLPASKPTIYSIYGNKVIIGLLFIILAITFAVEKLSIKKRKF